MLAYEPSLFADAGVIHGSSIEFSRVATKAVC